MIDDAFFIDSNLNNNIESRVLNTLQNDVKPRIGSWIKSTTLPRISHPWHPLCSSFPPQDQCATSAFSLPDMSNQCDWPLLLTGPSTAWRVAILRSRNPDLVAFVMCIFDHLDPYSIASHRFLYPDAVTQHATLSQTDSVSRLIHHGRDHMV